MPEPHMRAADSDRATVAAALGRAMADGRLTLEEYEERVGRAYAARTYGELAGLTADLPSPPQPAPAPRPVRPPAPTGACAPAWGRSSYGGIWRAWVTTAVIVTGIWLMTSIGSGHPIPFWPFWVIGPWGLVLLSRTAGRRPRPPVSRRWPPN